MSKEVAVESRLSRGVAVSRALAEDVVGIAARHAAGKAERVGALEVGGWVDRKATSRWGRKGLVTLHGLLGGGHEGAGKARNIIGARDRRSRREWRLRKKNIDGSGKGSSMFQFPVDGFCDQLFLVTE